jgi:hypothetical protein
MNSGSLAKPSVRSTANVVPGMPERKAAPASSATSTGMVRAWRTACSCTSYTIPPLEHTARP